MAGSLHELTDATFGSEVLEAKGVVLVDLWAPVVWSLSEADTDA